MTRIARVLQVTVTSNQHGALFHAPAMFSPGVESELALAMTIISGIRRLWSISYETMKVRCRRPKLGQWAPA